MNLSAHSITHGPPRKRMFDESINEWVDRIGGQIFTLDPKHTAAGLKAAERAVIAHLEARSKGDEPMPIVINVPLSFWEPDVPVEHRSATIRNARRLQAPHNRIYVFVSYPAPVAPAAEV